MRAQFVLENLMLTGGVRVVFEHARELRARGHVVRILTPRAHWPRLDAGLPAWKHAVYERWSGRIADGLATYGLSGCVATFEPAEPGQVPEADVVIATAWPTATWVSRFPAHAGVRYYFIQAYEAWTDDLREAVDATWRLPLRQIVVAGWLARLAQERFDQPVWARIPNGVDADRFHARDRNPRPPWTVGMLYDPAPHKGAADGIAALWRIHERAPETRLLLFGRARLRHRPPPGTRYIRDPLQADLPAVYRSIDVYLNSSHSEGFSLVILEAMSCGCATVATDVGETPEMGVPGTDYLMVPAGAPDRLADAVTELLENPGRMLEVARAGRAMAARYNWKSATDALECALGWRS